MGKGHYLGGSTLGGCGPISKSRGRKGGIGTSGAALREQRLAAEKLKKKEAAAKIKANEKVVKQLGRVWAAEKGCAHYEKLVTAGRVNVSPLAAALRVVLPA